MHFIVSDHIYAENTICAYQTWDKFFRYCLNKIFGHDRTSTCFSSKFISILSHAFFNQFSDYFAHTHTFFFSLLLKPIVFFISKPNWMNFFLNCSCHSIENLIHFQVVDILYDINLTTESAIQTTRHLVQAGVSSSHLIIYQTS